MYQEILRKHYPWILKKYNNYDFTQGHEKEKYLDSALKKELEIEESNRINEIIDARSSIYAIGFLHFETIMFCIGISNILNCFFSF